MGNTVGRGRLRVRGCVIPRQKRSIDPAKCPDSTLTSSRLVRNYTSAIACCTREQGEKKRSAYRTTVERPNSISIVVSKRVLWPISVSNTIRSEVWLSDVWLWVNGTKRLTRRHRKDQLTAQDKIATTYCRHLSGPVPILESHCTPLQERERHTEQFQQRWQYFR